MEEMEDQLIMDPFIAAALGLVSPSISLDDINKQNIDGWTMLMYACYYNQVETVYLLVTVRADRTLCCNRGRTALMIAAMNGNLDILKCVFEERILNQRDFFGETPLGVSIAYGHIHAADFLLSKGADANDSGKGTYLMSAAAGGHFQAVQLLLRYKADTTITNYQGKTARELAEENGQFEIANLIRICEEAGIEPVLKLLGLEEYVTLFTQHNISFEQFLNLRESEMKEIGIRALGKRRKLSLFLRDLKECYNGLFQPG